MSETVTEGVRLPVEGMTCGSCVARIERTVKKIVGVQAVRVSLRDETMTVRREPALVSNAALVQAVEDAGYRADPRMRVASLMRGTSGRLRPRSTMRCDAESKMSLA